MDSIAVTKPDMGVLSRERLPLSPFGVLAQAFAEDLLARAEQEEGRWPFVPLDLLEEGEEPPAPAAGSPRTALQVDLQLVLEVLRREENSTEQRRATERIVERILRLKESRDRPRRDKTPASAQNAGPSMTVLGTLRQEYHQHLTQNIRIVPTLSPGAAPQGRQTPGTLARQAADFSRQLQTLREEGKAFPPPSLTTSNPAPALGRAEPTPIPAPNRVRPLEGQTVQALPREALTLLEEQGDEAARNVTAVQISALRQAGERLQKLVADTLEQERPAPVQGISSPREENRRTRSVAEQPVPTPRRETAQTPQQHPFQTASEAPGTATANAPRTPDGQTGPSFLSARKTAELKPENTPRPAPTAARDIRMGRDTGPMDTIVPTSTASAAQAQGQAPSAQPPVELTLKPEQEPDGESAAVGRQGISSAGTPAKAGQASAVPEHRETSAAQKPVATEQEHTSQAVHSTARDIRMGREVRSTEAIAPATASVRPGTQGLALFGQAPVELSLKTEQDPAAVERQSIPAAGRSVKVGRSPAGAPAKAEQTSAASEHRDTGPAPKAKAEQEITPPAVRTAARDIRMGRVTEPMEAVTLAAAVPAPQAQGQILSGQAPVELSLKTEPEAAGESAAVGRQSVPATGRPLKVGQSPAGAPTKAEHTSAASEHGDTVPPPKAAADEQEYTPPAVRTAARDIRMGRVTEPMEAVTPAAAAPEPLAQRQVLPGQTPVELSLKTEPESAVEPAAAGRQRVPAAGRPVKVAQSPAGAPAKAEQTSAASEHRDTVPPPKVAADEQERTLPAVHTAARDIRMGRVTEPMEAVISAAAAPAPLVQEQILSGQAPVELSLKTEPESAVEPAAAGRQRVPAAGRPVKVAQSPAGAPAKAEQTSAASEHRDTVPPPKAAAADQEIIPPAVRTAARDIRMGRGTGPIDTIALTAATPAAQTLGQVPPTQAPVELSLKAEQETAGENAAGDRQAVPSAVTPAKAGQASAASEHRETRAVQKPAAAEQGHIPQAVQTAARDIRMGRETRPAETISPATVSPAPQTQRQALPGQPPVELSLRTEPEAAGEAAAPVPGGQTAQAIPVARRTAPQSAGPVPVHRTARDIRMQSHPFQRPADGSEIRSSVTQLGPRAAAAGPETETWSPAPTELALGPQGGSGETVTAAGAVSAGRTGWTEAQPEPVPLTYGPGQQQATQTPPQETAPSSGYRESEYVRSLPEWARNFLRSSADPQAAKTMGVARDISALQTPPAEEDVQWTAPNYRPPEAPIAYREKKREAAPQAVEEVRISEAEIQRTADRVYRIIEDRIRLERHRLGL